MSLNIGSSLTDGVLRVANRNGLKLILGYAVLSLVWQLTFYSVFVASADTTGISPQELGLPTIDAPFALLAVGAVVSLLALQYLSIVALRTFVGGHAETIPREYFTRNVGYVLVNSVLGSLAYGVLVTVGSLLLVVPGIIAYVAFLFTLVYVAVEDENFVAALTDSWTLTRGHWLRLFVLMAVFSIAVGAVAGVVSVVANVAVSAAADPSLGTLVSGLIALPLSLLGLGVIAEAYTQLRAAQPSAEKR
ncbi:hypothetical protein ABSL23_00645 (plasmid) [Halobacterium sp. NMX12-1]|uniref:DUF7847 domain-containing protein n=1 Tax=Halobacterium sp. NMX12-1 TaxID=3166650 RepID=A0AAU8C8R5_9EURY